MLLSLTSLAALSFSVTPLCVNSPRVVQRSTTLRCLDTSDDEFRHGAGSKALASTAAIDGSVAMITPQTGGPAASASPAPATPARASPAAGAAEEPPPDEESGAAAEVVIGGTKAAKQGTSNKQNWADPADEFRHGTGSRPLGMSGNFRHGTPKSRKRSSGFDTK